MSANVPAANSPFLVGVSGHRDLALDDVARLRGAITSFVKALKQRLVDTELRVIVGMAEGADLLVAQTALDLGVRVEAVLPMALEQYADDFDDPTLLLLEELLRHPEVRCTVLSAPSGDRIGPHTAAQRDAMYANLTQALIRRSSLLLALWDGEVSQLPGGTADTVLRYLDVRTDDDAAQQVLEFVAAPGDTAWSERLVFWAPAARSGAALPVGAHPPCFLMGGGGNLLYMQQEMPARLQRRLAQLNRYNREFQDLVAAGRFDTRNSLLLSLPPGCPIDDRPMLREIDVQYGKADTLAVYYQVRSDLLFALFGVMAFMMGIAYLIYEKVTESRALLVAYMVILLTSLGLYYLLQGKHWFAKHLTYRALAETLRAKFYLRLAGADFRVDAASLLALSGVDRFQGFGWMSYVLKGVEAPDIGAPVGREHAARQAQCVEQAWIDSQHRYFRSKVTRLENSSRNVKYLRNLLFVVIVLVIFGLFLFGSRLGEIQTPLQVPLKNLMLLGMGFLAVLLGAWELHQDKMATRELLWQYRNQLSHFTRAKLELARISSSARRIEILAALGKDSLMESYLWAIHRYHREHEPPAGH